VTDQQPKLGQLPELSGGFALPMGDSERRVGRTSGQAIKAGLDFLGTRWQDGYWQDSSSLLPVAGSDAWVTSCVLARLAELSPHYKSHALQRKIESSLDWLMRVRTPQGGWGSQSGEDDSNSTAWAIVALRAHGKTAPGPSLDFVRRCRRFDGGFAASPIDVNSAQPGVAEITAVAVRALDQLKWATEDFLAGYLRGAGPAAPGRRTARFHVCAGILDWRDGLASTWLLNQVGQAAAGLGNEGALDRAMLLRCLFRLRSQRAWSLAAGLRAMQMEDGSWSEHNDQKIMATVNAVSSLALGESQPGLYFGSDLPLPRRLHQS